MFKRKLFVSEPAPRWAVSIETLIAVVCAFWVLTSNQSFFAKALTGEFASYSAYWGFALGLAVFVFSLTALMLLLTVARPWAKWVLITLLFTTALATYYIERFGVFLDASMLRNVLKSNPAEASELLNFSLLVHIFIYAIIPSVVIFYLPVKPFVGWGRALVKRSVTLVAIVALAAVSLWSIYQPLASLMRNQKEVRYLVTPANYLYSLAVVAKGQSSESLAVRTPIGLDAKLTDANPKPSLLVVVVGETARAANWGLNHTANNPVVQTTPQLAKIAQASPNQLVNFSDVTACGTNTEVSLPCMFAPVGRRDYDEKKIRRSESLLHVLQRAGVQTLWRDNQSGCKGVCEGLVTEMVKDLPGLDPKLCNDGFCLDAGLLLGLQDKLKNAKGSQVIVLHQLGSHGPAYYKRYPKTFAQFAPACEVNDLKLCSREQITNAYNNTLLYTDHLLAELISRLKATNDVDTALVYVSDHGESLGENNLYLHGIPYAIAPDVQKKVPMFMWFSESFSQRRQIDMTCLAKKSSQAIAHDHLFHTLLSLSSVQTKLYEPAFDLTSGCQNKLP